MKNDDKKILPLSPEYRRIAVIGPDAVEARLGGYSGPGIHPVSILDGLKAELGEGTQVNFAEGCGRSLQEWTFVEGKYLFHETRGKTEKGLQAAYFNNIDLSGEPAFERTDEDIHFQWTLFSPDPSINYDFFSARWEGQIVSPVSGDYRIGIDGNEGYRLYLDGKLLIDTWDRQGYGAQLAGFRFVKDRPYDLRIEYREPSGNAWFRLIWDVGVEDSSERKIREAVRLARKSDVLIAVAGIEEGEFRDRSILVAPRKAGRADPASGGHRQTPGGGFGGRQRHRHERVAGPGQRRGGCLVPRRGRWRGPGGDPEWQAQSLRETAHHLPHAGGPVAPGVQPQAHRPRRRLRGRQWAAFVSLRLWLELYPFRILECRVGQKPDRKNRYGLSFFYP
ncbi:MAG: glycoside hydrolase family 3 C-terminal domain-containing protein [Saprospirales bacterium]|nr:glycoside hydrolase family 3 C-terminal domain-containing protein [Saprospirales bacterium]